MKRQGAQKLTGLDAVNSSHELDQILQCSLPLENATAHALVRAYGGDEELVTACCAWMSGLMHAFDRTVTLSLEEAAEGQDRVEQAVRLKSTMDKVLQRLHAEKLEIERLLLANIKPPVRTVGKESDRRRAGAVQAQF